MTNRKAILLNISNSKWKGYKNSQKFIKILVIIKKYFIRVNLKNIESVSEEKLK